MNWRIPLSDLNYGPEEEAAVLRVLRSRWLTMGEVTRDFELRFAERVGVKHAVAVSNATEALHLACLALDIGPGDEVIVPSLTFVATANAVHYTGARVRFADIDGPDELNVSAESIERQITPHVKAIMVVHYAGYPCRMRGILDVAERHGLAVIEDSAHAPGASIDGIALGAWGAAGCFSFFSNKNLVTGEGGMLVTRREKVAEKVRLLRSHAMTSQTLSRHQGHAYSYDVVDLGYNYRIDEIRSALGLAQLQKLTASNAERTRLTQRYWESLGDTSVGLPFRNAQGQSACHILPILLPPTLDRQRFIDHMREAGVQTSIHYPPVHQFQYYRQQYPDVTLPQTEDVARRVVTLPLFPNMGDEAVDTVVSAVRSGLEI